MTTGETTAPLGGDARAILQAVEGGGMPCDEAWRPERVELLQRWVEAGMPA